MKSQVPNIVTEKIEFAVEYAIKYGVSVDDFKETCAECWEVVLTEKLNYDRNRWLEAKGKS